MRTGHVAYERNAYFGSFMMHGNCTYGQLTQTVDFESWVGNVGWIRLLHDFPSAVTICFPSENVSIWSHNQSQVWDISDFSSGLSPLDAANPLEIMMVTPQWTRTALAVSFALGCPKGQSPRPCHCMVSPSRPIAKFSHNLNILVDVWWWC